MTDGRLEQLGMIRLNGGLAEASWYLRQPIALLSGAPVPAEVWTRWPTAGYRQPGDMPPINEVWLEYPDLWVTTLTHASPMLQYIGDLDASLRQIGGWVDQLRGGDHWPKTRLFTAVYAPETLPRMPREIAVVVAGEPAAVDAAELELVPPADEKHAKTIFGGPFPRFGT